MCQQQFDNDVTAQLRMIEEGKRGMQSMAEEIAKGSLALVRKSPSSTLNEWLEGRVCAAALIYPTPLTVGAKNECRFLAGEYAYRVRGML